MLGMSRYPDKYFGLAIVDPPYGIGEDGSKNKSRGKYAKDYKPYTGNDKFPPSREYFEELFRVSEHQIIWGANHFIENIPDANSSCWIVWDKDNDGNHFADCELAWANFHTAVRKFKWRWNGMLQENMKEKEIRIHPTQKPVALYEWLLTRYANDGDIILDTHVGSGSSRIACDKLGYSFIGFEIDEYYWKAQEKRYNKYKKQLKLL